MLASAVVVSTGVAQTISGISAAAFGYATHFALAAALTLIGGALSLAVVVGHDVLLDGMAEHG